MWCQILCVGIFAYLSHLIHFLYISCICCVLVCVFVKTLDVTVWNKKRNTPFHNHHTVEFILLICEHSLGTITVVVT